MYEIPKYTAKFDGNRFGIVFKFKYLMTLIRSQKKFLFEPNIWRRKNHRWSKRHWCHLLSHTSSCAIVTFVVIEYTVHIWHSMSSLCMDDFSIKKIILHSDKSEKGKEHDQHETEGVGRALPQKKNTTNWFIFHKFCNRASCNNIHVIVSKHTFKMVSESGLKKFRK